MVEVNAAYTVTVHDRSIEVIIFRHGEIDHVPDDDRQGWPETRKPHASVWTANKFLVEIVWRCKDDGSPPLAHMN